MRIPLATADAACMYLDENGSIISVRSAAAAPARFRKGVFCDGDKAAAIPAPDEITLQGAIGRASLATELGRIEVRWPRSVERCFGKSPARAAADAAIAVNKALKSARFSAEVKYNRQEWSLVFVNRATAIRDFPAAITLGGHPGFMIPPSQIYLLADVISPDCSQSGVSDALLTQVLLHEIGHAVEYFLLGANSIAGDRQRAEGFASWFEQYSADFAQGIERGSVKSLYRGLAVQGLASPTATFTGSAQDYAVASLAFQAIVDRKGIHALMKVYGAMREQGIPMIKAVEQECGWDAKMFQREMRRVVGQ